VHHREQVVGPAALRAPIAWSPPATRRPSRRVRRRASATSESFHWRCNQAVMVRHRADARISPAVSICAALAHRLLPTPRTALTARRPRNDRHPLCGGDQVGQLVDFIATPGVTGRPTQYSRSFGKVH
jgi:hypothetical protein